jgi:hypothetical protein
MIDGLLGEYLMSYEIKQRELELAHPRMAQRRELARLAALAQRATARPSLRTRVGQRVARAWTAVAGSVSATLSTLARDGSTT